MRTFFLYTVTRLMLKLYESTPGTLILSLRSGGPVATILAPIINPNNLYIEGWYVEDNRNKQQLILMSKDVRDVIPQGFAINDYEVLVTPEDLVRLKDILELRFDLIGLKVESESGRRYGKINDFAFETNNQFIQKMYVGQSIVKNFNGGTISIDRSQIIEVTNRKVVIEDPVEKVQSRATSASIIG